MPIILRLLAFMEKLAMTRLEFQAVQRSKQNRKEKEILDNNELL